MRFITTSLIAMLLTGCSALDQGTLKFDDMTDTATVVDTDVVGSSTVDDDGDGWTEAEGDCDDSNGAVFPQESDDIDPAGTDNNCDGIDGIDNDGDRVAVNGVPADCNDDDDTIFPGAREIAYNGINDDCDTTTPDDDLDNDGFLADEDCDDNRSNVNPDEVDLTDGLDNNCDGTPDNFESRVVMDGADTVLELTGLPALAGVSTEVELPDQTFLGVAPSSDTSGAISIVYRELPWDMSSPLVVADFSEGLLSLSDSESTRCFVWGDWQDTEGCDTVTTVPAPIDQR